MRQNQTSSLFAEGTSLRSFLLVCIIALIPRLLLFLYIAPNTPIKYYANSDAYNYENIALNLVNHGVFSNELQAPYVPDLHRTPLYPAFLAMLYAFSGSSESFAVLCQLLIGSLTVGLTYLFASALLRSHQSALFAALILALEPLSIMYANILVTETVFTFLLVAGSLALVAYFHSYRLTWLITSAIMFAGVALTRPIAQYLPIALIPLIVFAGWATQRWAALWRGLLFAFISLLLLFIWVFRNHQAAGVWLLSDIGEYNLAYYNARAVLQVADDISEEEAKARIDTLMNVPTNSETLSPAERVERHRQVALTIFRQHPLPTIKVYLAGLLQFVVNPGLDNICAQLSRVHNVNGCEVTRTMPNPGFVDKLRLKFGNMDIVQTGIAVWSVLILLALYMLSVAGVYILIKNRQWFELLNLVFIVAYLILLSAGGQTTSRFRVPTIPYWSVLTAVGFQTLRKAMRVSAYKARGKLEVDQVEGSR